MIFGNRSLEVWPGYVTSVHQFEDGLMLCIDVSHRVLRTETVHEVLSAIEMSHTYKAQVG
jgi:aubergine-like protein